MTTEPKQTTIYQNYLKDLGILLKDYALEAKQQADHKGTEFSIGYLAGYHRIISLMQQQAEAFDIPFEEIGLDRIDADEDLT